MIFLISGRTGSGKTALTKQLAGILGFPRTSFGDAVRAIAEAENADSTDKGILQKIGQRLVDQDAELLCRRVLDAVPAGSESAFVEGLRHKSVLSVIKELAGEDYVRLIHVDLDEATRVRRLGENRGWSPEQCAVYDDDPTELEIDGVLRAEADFVVDNGGDLPQVVELCAQWIRNLFRNC